VTLGATDLYSPKGSQIAGVARFAPPRRGVGGAGRARTGDFRLAKAALSQLSYSPTRLESTREAPGPLATAREDGGPKWI
jgi:hypothetical protein